ncbi:hypothetical protein VTH06DRAFT_6856 [Thermothelomyces fergusii]
MSQLGLPTPASRPTSPHSHSPSRQAYKAHSDIFSPSSDSDDDNSPLPFPAALSREDFLAPDFDPAAYLSALHTGGPASRHQTLEDLRAELRDRSAAISAELLELVNANYTAFLGLGDELKGGEEKVEDVRVALLGFRRAVEELQGKVRERRVEVGRLNSELEGVREAIEMGRSMLELDGRVSGLERRLAVESSGKGGRKGEDDGEKGEDWEGDFDFGESEEGESDVEEEEGGEEPGFVSSSPSKLDALAKEYVLAEQLADSLGRDLPFVKKMEERMARCRNTILLDLSTALREARKAGSKGQERVLRYLGVYRTLDAQIEALKVLKEK